jgi:DnaK suppressor protein
VSKPPVQRASSAKAAAKKVAVAPAGKKPSSAAKVETTAVAKKAASVVVAPVKKTAAVAQNSNGHGSKPLGAAKASAAIEAVAVKSAGSHPTAKDSHPAPAKSTAKAVAHPPAAATRKPEANRATHAKAEAPAAATAVPEPAPRHSPAKASFHEALAARQSPNQIMPKHADVLEPSRHATVHADPKLANAWKTKSGRELTDAEVLAMPEDEYMNDKQLEFFRAKLTLLKEDLLSNAGETTEHLREDTSIVPDPADRATIEEEHALELRTRDRERKLLKKISQALSRLDSGEYGFCDETGEPIGLGRLIARPTATLSLEAQQRRELKQKMFGD